MNDSFTVPGHGQTKIEVTLRKTDPGDPWYNVRLRWAMDGAVTVRFSHAQMEELQKQLTTLVENANKASEKKTTA